MTFRVQEVRQGKRDLQETDGCGGSGPESERKHDSIA